MTLLNGALAAAGLACVAIPIIIHLLMNRRRKPVMWGAMRFLLEAYRRQQKRLIVEKWLLLAARCLLVALVGLALGKPLLGALVGGTGGYSVFVLIDNGLAAQARATGGASALERHKRTAAGLVAALRERSAQFGGEPNRVGVIAMAGPAEGVVMPPSTDLGALGEVIGGLSATESRTDLPGALAIVSAAMAGQGADGAGRPVDPRRTIVVVLSDFAEGSLDQSPTGDALGATRLPEGVRMLVSEPAAGEPGNVSITGVEPLRSVLLGGAGGGGEGDLVRVALRRSGAGLDQAETTTVRAELRVLEGAGARAAASAGTTIERTTVKWTPGQDTAVAVAPLGMDGAAVRAMRAGAGVAPPPGVIVASVDNDAVPGDDRWFRPIDVRTALKVGVVAPSRFGKADRADRLDPGAWARLALAPSGDAAAGGGSGGGGEIEIVDIEPAALDGGRLAGLDALVVVRPDAVPEGAWARVRGFVDGGGLVLVTPPPNVTVHLWADAMTQGLGLGWSLAREVKVLQGSRVVRTHAASAGGPGGAGGVLSLIEGELDDLLKPVTVRRVLPMIGAGPGGGGGGGGGSGGQTEGGSAVLSLEDGSALLWMGAPDRGPGGESKKGAAGEAGSGRGLVAYLAVALDLDWSDLPAKPLMVPLVQELIRQGVGQARGSWWAVAGNRPGAPTRTSELVRVAGLDRGDPGERGGGAEASNVRVEPSGIAASVVRSAGVFAAFDSGGALRGVVAVNADARAGRMGTQTRQAVGSWLRGVFGMSGPANPATDPITWIGADGAGVGVGEAAGERVTSAAGAIGVLMGEKSRGTPIWYGLLIGALAVAVLELWLARWASHAQTKDVSAAGAEPAGVLNSPGEADA